MVRVRKALPLVVLTMLAVGTRAAALEGTSTLIAGGTVQYPAIEHPYIAWTDFADPSAGVYYFDERDGSTHLVDANAASEVSLGGGRLAYRCYGSDVCMFDPSTGVKTRVTNDSLNQYGPSISSKVLAWAEESGSTYVIRVRNLSTGATTTLSTATSADHPIARGSHVLFCDRDPVTSDCNSLLLYDAATNTTRTLASHVDVRYDLDLEHVVYTLTNNGGSRVVDFTGSPVGVLAAGAGTPLAISAEWVALIRGKYDGSDLDLWRWTTNEVFTTNAAHPDGSGGPASLDLDGTRVVYANADEYGENDSIYAFTFSSPPTLPLVFSDDFDACTSTTDLGGNWATSGTWYCRSGRARGEQPAYGTALAKTDALGDTAVQALVQLNSSDGSGLVARRSGGHFYAARILKAGQVDLARVDDGVWTVLASAPATILDTTSYTVGLHVSGSGPVDLSVTLNGVALVGASDTSAQRILSGTAGLLEGTGYRTQFDNFALRGLAPSSPPPPPPPPSGSNVSFADNFDACTSTTDLGPNWDLDGTFYCRSGRARGEKPDFGKALARTGDLTDTTISALVQLNSSDASGLVARYGDHHYALQILKAGMVRLSRVDFGTFTTLASAPATILDTTSYTLGLTVTGSGPVQLSATLNGKPIVSATDASGFAAYQGPAGLLEGTGYRTQFDNVTITGTSVGQPPPPPPPPASSFSVSDNFDACTSTVDLGPNWRILGRWYCQSGKARGETALGMAIANGTSGTDMTVQARVQLTSGASGSGVVARATAGGGYYAAVIVPGGRLRILRNGTVLADVPASISPEPSSYRVALVVSGSSPVSLTAYLQGSPLATATDDSSAAIASGSAGLLSGTDNRTAFDDFSAAGPGASPL